MLLEASVITIVLLVSAIMFKASGNKQFSVAVLPLVILPFMHVVGSILAMHVINSQKYLENIIIVFDFAGVVLGCILVGMTGQKFKNTKNKVAYKTMSGIFILILALVFVFNYT